MKDIGTIAAKVMPPPVHEDRTWAQDGDTGDIITAILSAEQWNQSQTAAVAPHLRGESDRETLRQVWFFVRNYIRYRKDRPGHERVKLPAKTWADQEGDCKSMAVFVAGLLKNLGIPAKYRFVSYRPGPVTHVYVVAKPKGDREVIVDAVNSKFDTEEPYKSKKDFPIMTKISVVHGLSDPDPVTDIPKKATPWRTINYGKLTEGELSMVLLAQQAEMKKNWYGDPSGQVQADIDALENALYHGVHRLGAIGTPRVSTKVIRAIQRAKLQTRPAGTAYASRRNPLREGLVPDMIGLPDEEFDKFFKDFLGQGICTPDTARGEYYQQPLGGYGYRIVGSAIDQLNANKSLTKDQRNKVVQACYDQGKVIKIFNEKLPGASHHILYNFILDPNASTGLVAAKYTNHRNAMAKLGPGISGLSLQNMMLWLRNGVMQTNEAKGEGKIGPISPEETIRILIDDYLSGVNEPVTLAAIAVIVGKIIAAAATVAGILKVLLPPKDQVALNTITGFSTEPFGPEVADWSGYLPKEKIGPNGQSIIINDPTAAKAGISWILPVILGGGLLLSGALK